MELKVKDRNSGGALSICLLFKFFTDFVTILSFQRRLEMGNVNL